MTLQKSNQSTTFYVSFLQFQFSDTKVPLIYDAVEDDAIHLACDFGGSIGLTFGASIFTLLVLVITIVRNIIDRNKVEPLLPLHEPNPRREAVAEEPPPPPPPPPPPRLNRGQWFDQPPPPRRNRIWFMNVAPRPIVQLELEHQD